MDIPIEQCKAAYAYKPSKLKKSIYICVFLSIYAVVLPYCYYTAGDPRYHAMLNAQKIADEKWLKESTYNETMAMDLLDEEMMNKNEDKIENIRVLSQFICFYVFLLMY